MLSRYFEISKYEYFNSKIFGVLFKSEDGYRVEVYQFKLFFLLLSLDRFMWKNSKGYSLFIRGIRAWTTPMGSTVV